MSTVRLSVVFVVLAMVCCVSWAAIDEGVATLDVIKHKPCESNPRHNKWNEILRFPDQDEQAIVEDGTRKGCYKLGGRDVDIQGRLRTSQLFLHVELRGAPGENGLREVGHCQNYEEDQCEGFGGDCLYCNVCSKGRSRDKPLSEQTGAIMWLTFDGDRVDCEEGFKKAGSRSGNGEGLYLHFCLPTRDEMLRTRDISRSLWDRLTGSNKDGSGSSKTPRKSSAFITIRLLDRDLRESLKAQRLVSDLYKQTNGEYAEAPWETRAQWPFNRILWSSNGGNAQIMCHQIVGDIAIE